LVGDLAAGLAQGLALDTEEDPDHVEEGRGQDQDDDVLSLENVRDHAGDLALDPVTERKIEGLNQEIEIEKRKRKKM